MLQANYQYKLHKLKHT